MDTGWIKLKRSLRDWEWWHDHNATRLLVYLLVSVNYQDKNWQGMTIKAGSMILSWDTLSVNVGLTVRQCRTAMDKLVGGREVTRKVTNKYQVVTLVKWAQIQSKEKQVTGKPFKNGQTDDSQMTTTKESKEYKEVVKPKLKKFFKDKAEFKDAIQKYITNKNFDLEMVNEFFEYWSEPNPSGTLRVNLEKTYDISRRLGTWKRNQKKF